MAALKNLAVDYYSGIFSPCPPQKITHLNANKSCAESIQFLSHAAKYHTIFVKTQPKPNIFLHIQI